MESLECLVTEVFYSPLVWHLGLMIIAGLQAICRHISKSEYRGWTIWDMGSWCVLFLTGVFPMISNCHFALFLKYLILSPPLFIFGMWVSENVFSVKYNEGAIAHLFALYIYIGVVFVNALVGGYWFLVGFIH